MFEVVFWFALVLLGFAAVHDWKTTFVSDWVVYALFCLGLVSLVLSEDVRAGLYVLGGMVMVSGLFYYGKVFAEGDARLLIALALVLPGFGLVERGWYAGGFVFALLVVGLLYTLVISGVYASRTPAYIREVKHLVHMWRAFWWMLVIGGFGGAFVLSWGWWMLVMGGLWVAGLLYVHARAVEQTCLTKRTAPAHLLEGDWLVSSVRVEGRVIRATHAGLTRGDIALLRKHQRFVVIKQGIPFVPVFFISYVFMGYVALGGYGEAIVRLVERLFF